MGFGQFGLVCLALLCMTSCDGLGPDEIGMCTQATLGGIIVSGTGFKFASPNYPYIYPHGNLADETVICVCRLDNISDYHELVIKTLSMDYNNTIPGKCTSEYVIISKGVPFVEESNPIKQCTHFTSQAFFNYAHISYVHNASVSRFRGTGSVHTIRVERTQSGPIPSPRLRIRCYTSFRHFVSTTPTSANDSRTTRKPNGTKPNDKLHLLFVFGISALGTFILILCFVIVYFSYMFAKRRFSMDDGDIEPVRRIPRHPHNTAPALYSLPQDTMDVLMRNAITRGIPINEPRAPPAYIENPPKYESIFGLLDDDVPSDTTAVEDNVDGTNIHLDQNGGGQSDDVMQSTEGRSATMNNGGDVMVGNHGDIPKSGDHPVDPSNTETPSNPVNPVNQEPANPLEETSPTTHTTPTTDRNNNTAGNGRHRNWFERNLRFGIIKGKQYFLL